MAAAPLEQTFWETLCDLIGLEPELHDEEKFYSDESSCCRNHCDREVSWRSRCSLGIISCRCTYLEREPSRARAKIMSLSDELVSLSSVEMRRRIGTKEVSPVELVEASIARIEALNPTVNAIAATDFAHARKLAISAESAARKGEQLGPLHGLPTGIKDLHETAGLLTTYGSPLYRSHVPAHD